MSFILDALKKSDHERQQIEKPHLHVTHEYPPALRVSHSGGHRKKYVLFFAGVLLGIFGLGSFFFWYTTQQPQIIQTQTTTTPASKQKTTISISHLPPKIIEEKNKIPLNPVPDTPLLQPTVPSLPQKQVQSTGVLSFKDLPTQTQERMPKLTFAGHTYSKVPEQRMIIINNKILREGESINENLHLVEITWEGVVLDFDGVKFSKKIQ